MLLSIFSSLYELAIGENLDLTEYRDSIFSSVGTITFICSLILCLIFYVLLGRWKGIWYNRFHWVITITVSAVIGFGFAYSMASSEIGEVDSYLIRFAIFNALYAAIYFILLSFVFKNFSIHSKRTPF